MLTYVFPGQGSQHKGMGGSLFDEFIEEAQKADEILGYSIKTLCLENPDNKLNQTQYTQPALYTVNALTYLKKIRQDKKTSDYLAGHSLGEYSALFASGAFDFETGLRLVQRRGALMSRMRNGQMAAIIGLREEQVDKILKENGLESIDIANYNSPSQIVISGPGDCLIKAETVFKSAGAKMFVPLNVSGAFHSRYMSDAADEFKEFLRGIEFKELSIPVISNVYAKPYTKEKIIENLTGQITHSVLWIQSIRYLMGQGNMIFEEIGPGNVLTKLIKSIEEDKEHEKVEKKGGSFFISVDSLGSREYREDYNVKYAYAAGGMYRGISSTELVVKMGRAGLIGYLGTGGLSLERIEKAIIQIQDELGESRPYGVNLLCNHGSAGAEEKIVDLLLKHKVRNIEASAFLQITPALVRYRAQGLIGGADKIARNNKILAKLSRPEMAEMFLSPAPEKIVKKLVEENKITKEQAGLLNKIPMADDICVEADSGGHTDRGIISALLPAIIRLRDDLEKKYGYHYKVRVGAAGGIGAPEAAASAFILGADFILTGSVNQCTVEAGTSDNVKDLLEQMNVQDTDYAPAGDMFEMGAKVQVLKRGLFFPARANKLFDLYQRYNSLDEIDEKTRRQLQDKYFKRSFDDIFEDVRKYFLEVDPQQIEKAKNSPKHKMALVFRWYFNHATNLALTGNEEKKVDYQIYCGPALGAFNQWVKGSELESWRNRHVDQIAEKIMSEAAQLLNRRFYSMRHNGGVGWEC